METRYNAISLFIEAITNIVRYSLEWENIAHNYFIIGMDAIDPPLEM